MLTRNVSTIDEMISLLLDRRLCIDFSFHARFNQRSDRYCCSWKSASSEMYRAICSMNNVIGEIRSVFNFIVIPNNALFDYLSCLTRPASSRLINASDSTWRSPAIRFTTPDPIHHSNTRVQNEFDLG